MTMKISSHLTNLEKLHDAVDDIFQKQFGVKATQLSTRETKALRDAHFFSDSFQSPTHARLAKRLAAKQISSKN